MTLQSIKKKKHKYFLILEASKSKVDFKSDSLPFRPAISQIKRINDHLL